MSASDPPQTATTGNAAPSDPPPTRRQWVIKVRDWLHHVVGVDSAIAFTVLARSWSSFAGFVTVLLIARFLSPAEQGYYYTFSSLVAIQLIFELGFSFVVLQLAAHERVNLSINSEGYVAGNAAAHSRLASVLQKSIKWYSVAALLMLTALITTGFMFFRAHQRPGIAVNWQLPWILLALFVPFTFQMDPVFSFLEGCGYVANVARMRLGQAVLGSTLAWLAMLTRHGLYAPAMVIVGQATAGAIFLAAPVRFRLLKDLISYRVREHFVSWRREILPFQWRIALSSLSGYFIFQLFNPVLFAYQGPVAAGRMGMSLSISSAIGAVAMSWMNTKASPFGNMIAAGQIDTLDRLFFRTLRRSTGIAILGAGSFLTLLLVGERTFPKLASRALSPFPFLMILMAMIINQIIFAEALYLRSHKREPFLVLSVAGAFLQGLSTWLCAKYWSITAVAVSMFLCTFLVGFPAGTWIFISKRREWHARGGLEGPASGPEPDPGTP